MAELTVRMPALSATMEDAELLAWLVEVGDEVRSGQPLAEVATDKVDMELESPHDGVVAELLVDAGQRVDLGAPVATLTSEEEDLLGDLDLDGGGAAEAEAPTDGTAPRPSAAARAEDGPDAGSGPDDRRGIPLAPPPVRKRAKQLGIDLHRVAPTGNRGHITHRDLDAFLDQGPTEPAASEPDVRSPAPPAAATSPSSPGRERPSAAAGRSSGERDRRRAIRLATARTTIRSAAIPQFTLFRGIDASRLLHRRGSRSVTTELARALAAALWRHPECNGTWDEQNERVVPLDTVRIGIAVDTPDGLVVVGVDDPDAVAPEEADTRIKQAVTRARDGKLTAEDTQDISSTISNLGGFGIDRFHALLVPPQPTILSVGRTVETPIMVDGRVRPMPKMELGLTVDHRVADGADGARLLDTLAQRLES